MARGSLFTCAHACRASGRRYALGPYNTVEPMIHRIEDESQINADILAYTACIDAVLRNVVTLNDPRLIEILQALQDVSIALQQYDEKETPMSCIRPPPRCTEVHNVTTKDTKYTFYALCNFYNVDSLHLQFQLRKYSYFSAFNSLFYWVFLPE